jgi:PKD repeat protein
VAAFSGSPLSGTAPLLVAFTDLSSGSIDTWAWSFGDTGTSNLASPSHTYTSPGTYTVSLTVTGPGGMDVETKTNYVTVDPPPTGGGLYYLSFDSNTSVPGVGTVADEDVVTYDPASDTWALYFDGSDVGLGGTNVNALHVLTSPSPVRPPRAASPSPSTAATSA